MSKKLFAIGGMLVAAALLTGPAFANALGTTPNATQSITVFKKQLNLDTRTGATRELSRIDRSAQEVCGGPPLPQMLRLTARYDTCYENAIRSAVNTANLPTLKEAYGNSSRMGATDTVVG